MGKSYRTSEVAEKIGIHPNTVRLYEDLQLISRPERLPNGYRVYEELHLEQFRLARAALQVEVLQRGLRKRAIGIIKTAARGEYHEAEQQTKEYIAEVRLEQRNAEEAILIAEELIKGTSRVNEENGTLLTRKEVAELLGITMDSLRNWEMNGLLTVKRMDNGYRVYGEEEIRRLKMIRSLRCANYSLASILRMIHAISREKDVNLMEVMNTPKEEEDIISACDQLITSLKKAEENGEVILGHLHRMKDMEK